MFKASSGAVYEDPLDSIGRYMHVPHPEKRSEPGLSLPSPGSFEPRNYLHRYQRDTVTAEADYDSLTSSTNSMSPRPVSEHWSGMGVTSANAIAPIVGICASSVSCIFPTRRRPRMKRVVRMGIRLGETYETAWAKRRQGHLRSGDVCVDLPRVEKLEYDNEYRYETPSYNAVCVLDCISE